MPSQARVEWWSLVERWRAPFRRMSIPSATVRGLIPFQRLQEKPNVEPLCTEAMRRKRLLFPFC